VDGIHIRKAGEEDLPGILEIYAGIESEAGAVLDLESAKGRLRKIGGYPNYAVYVAEQAGSIVGTFALLIMDNLAHGGAPSAVVEDVVVREERRGMGIGGRMMKFALEICRREGCYKLTLSSNAKRTRAHAFYESLGFQRHGYSFSVNL
jgi:GNAT superfamily N-acetyltransferase